MILKEKLKEVVVSVVPVAGIVLLLFFTIAPVEADLIYRFVIGTVLLIVGLTIFLIGADVGVLPMGEMMGSSMVRSRKLWVFIVAGFIIGFMVTMAEPDVQVLAQQFSQVTQSDAISVMTVVLLISVGVGLFLVSALLRIVYKVRLSTLLWLSYLLLFGLAIFSGENFLPAAFDSGGVTTGPMTVPFILAIGIGVSGVMGSKSSEEDSFGLVAMSSVGPILMMLILGILFRGDSGQVDPPAHHDVSVLGAFLSVLPPMLYKVGVSMVPMCISFAVYQIFVAHLPMRQVLRIVMGLVYTALGIVLFLVAVEGGFMEAGLTLGEVIGKGAFRPLLVPIGFALGFTVVLAEPAVKVLTEQVQEVSGGYVGKRSILLALSLAVGVSVAISFARILAGFSIWWYLIPGYAIALLLMRYSPPVYTAIAFDSGGVASGPMSATFILAMSQGVALAADVSIMKYAFGTVAMVAMTPLITIQVLGVIIQARQKRISDSIPREG